MKIKLPRIEFGSLVKAPRTLDDFFKKTFLVLNCLMYKMGIIKFAFKRTSSVESHSQLFLALMDK